MNGKIQKSQGFIREIMNEYNKPAILCSFGKDSIVLLHLIRSMGLKLPVLFYREPFSPKKYAYADQIIRDWDLTVYDSAPMSVGFYCVKGVANTINYQKMGGDKNMARMTGLVPPRADEPFLCVLEDLIDRPLGQTSFPWDVCFHGHKNADNDPVTGAIPLLVDVLHVPNSNDYAYPLRDWTDADIWQYIEENKIPINHGRYEKTLGVWGDISDKSLNSDYFAACWKCVDRSEAASVQCPKNGRDVNNVSASVRYDPLQFAYMGNKPGE